MNCNNNKPVLQEVDAKAKPNDIPWHKFTTLVCSTKPLHLENRDHQLFVSGFSVTIFIIDVANKQTRIFAHNWVETGY